MSVSKFDTFAKYNGRNVMIVAYGPISCEVRYLSGPNPFFNVPTSHLQGDEYDPDEALQPGIDYL